jgi:hypothetical protein
MNANEDNSFWTGVPIAIKNTSLAKETLSHGRSVFQMTVGSVPSPAQQSYRGKCRQDSCGWLGHTLNFE